MRHKIILGDWSGDGHQLTTPFIVEIPDQFTDEILAVNYQTNKTLLGFGYEDVAGEYEEAHITADQMNALKFQGLSFATLTAYADREDDSYIVNTFRFNDQTLFWGKEEYLKVVMFMIGNGLAGFTWEIVPEPKIPLLLGGQFAALGNSGAGYGMYSF